MKAIKTDVIITSLRSKVDRSLSLTLHTPELSSKEKALFMDLQGQNCKALFEPEGEKVPVEKIDREITRKSQGQRLRAVLFVYWKALGEKEEFETFYKTQTEKIIDHFKRKLD